MDLWKAPATDAPAGSFPAHGSHSPAENPTGEVRHKMKSVFFTLPHTLTQAFLGRFPATVTNSSWRNLEFFLKFLEFF